MRDSPLHALTVVIVIVALLIAVQKYAVPAITDRLSNMLEKAASIK